MGVSMSEVRDYQDQLQIMWTGVDTARYAITYSDSVLQITYKSDCFQAIKRHRQFLKSDFVISVQGDTTIRVGQSLFDLIASQYNIKDFTDVYSATETLRYAVSKRDSKAFVPKLRNVEFHFAEQLGVSGQPILEPDTVWLYGSPSSLARISDIYTAATIIDHISDSGYYAIPLEPVWKSYPDLSCSHDVLRLYVPVERFAEVVVKVPVEIRSNAPQGTLHLYPNQVEVTAWVTMDSYNKLDAADFQATVDFDISQSGQRLPVKLTRFPSQVRIKHVKPAELEYVYSTKK